MRRRGEGSVDFFRPLVEDVEASDEVAAVVAVEMLETGSSRREARESEDEAVGLHRIRQLDVDRPSLETGKDGAIHFMEGAAAGAFHAERTHHVHAARVPGVGVEDAGQRKWRHFLAAWLFGRLLAPGAYADHSFDGRKSLHDPEALTQVGVNVKRAGVLRLEVGVADQRVDERVFFG